MPSVTYEGSNLATIELRNSFVSPQPHWYNHLTALLVRIWMREQESTAIDVIQGLNGLLMAAAIAVFIGYLGIYLLYAWGLFRFPYDYDQGEGFEVNDAVLFSQGQWPYRDNEVYPFYASNYPPLYHLIMIPLFPAQSARHCCRDGSSSVAATFVIGATVGGVVWRKTKMAGVAALCGLMVFASNYIYHIGPLARLHLIMVMFELLAVVFVAQSDDARHGTRNLVFSLIFLTAAGWTKQLALATVLAVFLYLFIRNPKRAFVSGAIFAAVNAALFLAVNIATQGTVVPQHHPGQRQCLRFCPGVVFVSAVVPLALGHRFAGGGVGRERVGTAQGGRPIRSGLCLPCWTRRWPASGARANRTLRRRWWRRACARDCRSLISNL